MNSFEIFILVCIVLGAVAGSFCLDIMFNERNDYEFSWKGFILWLFNLPGRFLSKKN